MLKSGKPEGLSVEFGEEGKGVHLMIWKNVGKPVHLGGS